MLNFLRMSGLKLTLDNLNWIRKDDSYSEVTAVMAESLEDIKLVFRKPVANDYDSNSEGMQYFCTLYVSGEQLRVFEDWGERRGYMRWIRMILKESESYWGHPFTIDVIGNSRSM